MGLKDKEIHFLKMAIETADNNLSDQGGPFGAVIVRNDEVLARAGNRVVPGHDPTAHAEIEAIRQAAALLGTHDLDGCVIYASCEPCPMCLGAIYWSGIKRIVYSSDRYRAASAGFDDNFIYEELKLEMGERSVKMVRGIQSEGDKVFERWERLPYKVKY